MILSWHLVIQIIALVCLFGAAVRINEYPQPRYPRWNLGWLGLFLWCASTFVTK